MLQERVASGRTFFSPNHPVGFCRLLVKQDHRQFTGLIELDLIKLNCCMEVRDYRDCLQLDCLLSIPGTADSMLRSRAMLGKEYT